MQITIHSLFKTILKLFRHHGLLIILIAFLVLYIVVQLRVIEWGIPSQSVAFPHALDEWHFFMGDASIIKHFTNNVSGAQRGPMFFLTTSTLYLGFFVLLHVIHPSLLSDRFSPTALTELNHIFLILRSFSLIFSILTLILMYIVSKRQLRINPLLTVVLLGTIPLWAVWSDIYKYEIANVFWITASIYLLLTYKSTPKRLIYCLGGVTIALAIATKVSSTPLLPLYIVAFFLFTRKPLKNIKTLLAGLLISILTFAVFGIPDVIFLRTNWGDYISSGFGATPNGNYGMPWYLYLITKHYQIIFGHAFYFLILLAGIYYLWKLPKAFSKRSISKFSELFFLGIGLLLFCVTLIQIGIGASGYRLLPTLPFLVLLVSIALNRLLSSHKLLFTIVVCCIIAFQMFESYAWLYARSGADTHVTSSMWIVNHIPKGSKIGMLNIPLYQAEPNILLLDYYRGQNHTYKGLYQYEIIDYKTKNLPDYIIISDAIDTKKFVIISDKNYLVDRLNKMGYKIIATFKPDHTLYYYFADERDYFFSEMFTNNAIYVYRKSTINHR